VRTPRGKIDQHPGEPLADCGAACRTNLSPCAPPSGSRSTRSKSGHPECSPTPNPRRSALTFTISARPVIGDLVITTRPERPHRDGHRQIALGQGCRPCTPLLCRVPDFGSSAQLRKPSTKITRIGSTIHAHGSSASLSGSEVFRDTENTSKGGKDAHAVAVGRRVSGRSTHPACPGSWPAAWRRTNSLWERSARVSSTV
jgi:hypothetical protein